jgi:hypothetical protein
MFADLSRQVARHGVDRIGQIFPRPGDVSHVGLAAELALGADLTGHTGDLGGEGAELLDHEIDRLRGAQELAFEEMVVDFEGHAL